MEVIFSYINEKIKRGLKNNFQFIIGGGCLIKRNIINSNSNFFRYITLYNELEEKEGNYTDFFLYIKNEQKREAAVNEILKNNIWNYFKKIKYDYKNEFKKILDENGEEIGYIVRAIELSHIESYLCRKKQKEQIINITSNIPLKNENISNNNTNINNSQMQNNINNNMNNNINNNMKSKLE